MNMYKLVAEPVVAFPRRRFSQFDQGVIEPDDAEHDTAAKHIERVKAFRAGQRGLVVRFSHNAEVFFVNVKRTRCGWQLWGRQPFPG